MTAWICLGLRNDSWNEQTEKISILHILRNCSRNNARKFDEDFFLWVFETKRNWFPWNWIISKCFKFGRKTLDLISQKFVSFRIFETKSSLHSLRVSNWYWKHVKMLSCEETTYLVRRKPLVEIHRRKSENKTQTVLGKREISLGQYSRRLTQNQAKIEEKK